ncbi:rRNA-processing protein UTP23 homolog isoform X2 [Hydractinia symbiolongicarpus]|uniref:rRNA-processing protein UTP23 homolog isoform X2 n=1 Tax=Hydractinia symbiolongicarpus TaxID=13093 RepID=UPI00254C6646|nr:rRNA-processing protein UTP23 homolog isoform X2 [Hydractinia symbiolongicarpus]
MEFKIKTCFGRYSDQTKLNKMRVKRLKHCKKLVAFYKTTFGFHEPYQILIDLTFCQFALMYKINIKEQIPKYIEGESQLFTTKCILDEGKLLGPQLHGAHLVCKQFKLRKCTHNEPVSAQECIQSMIGEDNNHHLFVASQDNELRNVLRKIPGVPLLHIHYNTLVLEKPSKFTKREAQQIDSSKTSTSEYEKSCIKRLKQMKSIEEPKEWRRKNRKMKGVNPLAMKKKKKKMSNIVDEATDQARKRHRRRKKIAQHIVDEFKARQTVVS